MFPSNSRKAVWNHTQNIRADIEGLKEGRKRSKQAKQCYANNLAFYIAAYTE